MILCVQSLYPSYTEMQKGSNKRLLTHIETLFVNISTPLDVYLDIICVKSAFKGVKLFKTCCLKSVHLCFRVNLPESAGPWSWNHAYIANGSTVRYLWNKKDPLYVRITFITWNYFHYSRFYMSLCMTFPKPLHVWTRNLSQYKDSPSMYRSCYHKDKTSGSSLIFLIGIPILEKWHLSYETAPLNSTVTV